MGEVDQEETQSSGTGVDASLARHGGLSYLEIPAVDKRESAPLYEQVLGWNVRGQDTDDPRFSDATGHLVGRLETDLEISRKPGLLPFFYVDQIDAVLARASATARLEGLWNLGTA